MSLDETAFQCFVLNILKLARVSVHVPPSTHACFISDRFTMAARSLLSWTVEEEDICTRDEIKERLTELRKQ